MAQEPFVIYEPKQWFFSPYYLAYLLQAGGFRVFIENEGKSQFGEAVPPREGRVQVLISSSRLRDADEYLERTQARDPGSHETCPTCGESVPREFEVCWSCGADRAPS
jgi:hypothetical protein